MKQGPTPAQRVGAGPHGARVDILASWPAATGLPGALRLAAALVLAGGLAGCAHRAPWVPPNVLTAPVALEPTPAPSYPPEISDVPPPVFIPLDEAQPFPHAPRRRPTSPREAAAGPQAPQVPEAAAPANDSELALGSLSAGGEAAPQIGQQARDLIGSIQRRVAALPHSVLSQQRNQIRQVNSFLKRAQQALDSGDAEGSVNLATKARLIMDDIERH